MPKETKFSIEGVNCPVQRTLAVIGDKWTVLILHQLMDRGTLRFGELRKVLPGITQKVLTKQLRALELDGLISRTVYAEVPPRVEYTLTELGASLDHVFVCMGHWGRDHADEVAHNRKSAIMGLRNLDPPKVVSPNGGSKAAQAIAAAREQAKPATAPSTNGNGTAASGAATAKRKVAAK